MIRIYPDLDKTSAADARVKLDKEDPNKLRFRFGSTFVYMTRDDWRKLNDAVVAAIEEHESKHFDELMESYGV